METKIASYQEPGIRLQLVQIEKEDIGTDGMPTSLGTTYYQIRRNRKVLCNLKWEGPARQKFAALIQQELLQTNMFRTMEEAIYEEKKLYKITMGGKFYIEEKEITPDKYRSIIYNNQNKIGNPIHVTYTEDKRFIILKETTYEEYKKI